MGPMAKNGEEAIGSMGTDTPLAVLSDRQPPLFNYFKQMFAQVTNPPLDAIREELVTSMSTALGPERNLLKPVPESGHMIKILSPIMDNDDLAKLRYISQPGFRSATLPMSFKVSEGGESLRRALHDLFEAASTAIKSGATILILSDRHIDKDSAPIPSLLATSGLHHPSGPGRNSHKSDIDRRNGRCTGSPSLLPADWLRSVCDQSVSRVRDPGRHDSAGPADGYRPSQGRQSLHEGC